MTAMVAAVGHLLPGTNGSECSQCLTIQRQTLNFKIRKHTDIHDRPYKCPVPSCSDHVRGFATKGVLERHKTAKHSDLTPRQRRKEFYCPQQDCHRSISAPRKDPFTRKDHLRDHIKRIHNRGIEQAPVLVQDDPLSCIISQQRAGTSRDESEDPLTSDELHATSGSQERRRVEDAPFLSCTTGSAREEWCGHVQQVQELRKEMADLKRRLEEFEAREADFKAREADVKAREAKLVDRLFDLLNHQSKPSS